MSDPFAHCEALVRAVDKDRYLAALFAPVKHRRPLMALYAFDVEVARVRDLAREPMPGEIRLQWWRDVFTGTSQSEARAHPVAAALLDTLVRYRLPPRAFVALVDAHAFDLYDEPMKTLVEFEGYAAETSSAVIELGAIILNEGHGAGVEALAGHLGVALTTSRVLAALPMHAARRQLYLPLDVLQRYAAAPDDIFAGRATPELRAALAELRLVARRHLAEAKALLAAAPSVTAPALLPAALVRVLLACMERRGYDPFAPVSLAQWRRQWVLWRAARKGLRHVL